MNLRWGIVGLGKIANKFAKDLLLIEGCTLQAVGSRNKTKAEDFAEAYNAVSAYDSYTDLYKDEEVDIVYVATPHNAHLEVALEAMRHGKHVLCEKPLAINRSQVQQMIATAKTHNVFLMEAFWTRFNPTFEAVLKRVENKDIGEVNYINADFSFYRDASPQSRLFNLALAGGALLDVGVYPIFLAYSILGYPESVTAVANKHQTGADMQTAAILKYPHGIANIMCGFRSASDMVARIYGTKGKIFIDKVWHESEAYRIEMEDSVSNHAHSKMGKGFTYEILECMECIGAGRLESLKWSHKDSLNLISICDEIRSQIGLKYPVEEE